ncbi:hypothetical protein FRC0547_00924 [Corynebacterium diphtheriae]|nr:hypothetical protein CIP107566_00567 [Corynebacterium diphtheriae]CAB1008196.1 hypothetical protein FRC0515_00865 [Corynebacterium diphtheriae]CAB1035668.1 hypothetical protein FRC0547_00924 [Corynebacterium diphtheriae]
MNPTITDKDSGKELWRVEDCAKHCGINTNTWRTYTSTGRAPQPVAELGKRMPLWDAEEVQAWHKNRPGSPVANAPQTQQNHDHH